MTSDLIDRLKVLGSTNTQTRRLGYVVQICKLLADNYAPQVVLQKRIEDWADDHNSALRDHISAKGRLSRSPRSYGSRRYIKLAQDLQLITEVSGYLRPTITGLVLTAVNNQSHGDNPFHLESSIALLFCYQLLLLDADYLLPTLQLTSSYHEQDQLLEIYQNRLSSRFEVMEAQVQFPLLRSEIHERLGAITRWTKPVIYSEHIVMPRLHWLLDLNLLDWNSFDALREFEPSAAGRRFIDQLPTFNGHTFVNQVWCQNIVFSAWAQAFNLACTPWHSLPEDSQARLIESYVATGFRLFRTETHYRISAYQLILFSILKLLSDQKVLAGFEDIKTALSAFSGFGDTHWNFFWSAIDNDGYLTPA